MSELIIPTSIPGLAQANNIMGKLRSTGIRDVQLLYDHGIQPQGMWAVVQVQKLAPNILLPRTYQENGVRPYIMWWCKNEDGTFRVPNESDLNNILVVIQRAQKIWEKPKEFLADKLDDLSMERELKHRAKLHKTVQDIAPDMKKAIKNRNF